jgi:uncharacterized phage-associated protein
LQVFGIIEGIMVNIFDVAQHILNSIEREVSSEKLHALCYYCQAWHLAMYGVPLFEEDFIKCENWDWERGSEKPPLEKPKL